MKRKNEQTVMKSLLTEAITVLCRASLQYRKEFHVEGLIGITLDNEEIFLVNLNEHVEKDDASQNTSKQNDPKPVSRQSSPASPKPKQSEQPEKRKSDDLSARSPRPRKQAKVSTEPIIIKDEDTGSDHLYGNSSSDSTSLVPPEGDLNERLQPNVTISPSPQGIGSGRDQSCFKSVAGAHSFVQSPAEIRTSSRGSATGDERVKPGCSSWDSFSPTLEKSSTASSIKSECVTSACSQPPQPSAINIKPENKSVSSTISSNNDASNYQQQLPLNQSPCDPRGVFTSDQAVMADHYRSMLASRSNLTTHYRRMLPPQGPPLFASKSPSASPSSFRQPSPSPFHSNSDNQSSANLNFPMLDGPFECDECHKKFPHKSRLQQHMIAIHSSRKEFWCPICHQLFAKEDECHKHVRERHKETPEKFNEQQYKSSSLHALSALCSELF